MNYYITAYDANSAAKNTDAISRDVRDTFPPVASCALTVQANMGDAIAFDGTASTDNIGIANYSWVFNVQQNQVWSQVRLYGPRPSRIWAEPGVFETWLIVTDAWNNTDSQSFNVTILDPEGPVADAGYELTVFSGNLLFFDGSASTDNHRIANYTWEFDHNGTAIRLYGQSPEYIFWEVGDHSVTLTVADSSGNTATDQVPVHVLKARGGGGIPWWAYALAIMIILIVAIGLFIIKT
jgi:PKD repeat protein